MTLREIQQQMGAVFSEQELLSAVHFGNPLREYRAATQSAALFDVSNRTLLQITGRDRAKFLHNFCTNDILKLQPGETREAFVTNVKARVLGHIFVAAMEEFFWVDSVPGAAATLLPHLDRYLITEEVFLHDRTQEMGKFYLSGPEAIAILHKLGLSLQHLKPGQFVATPYEVATFFLLRLDWLKQPGFLILLPLPSMRSFWQALVSSGAVPAGSQVFHVCRMEAGFPIYGIDITEDQLAPEAGRTELAISFRKGCYLGQEPIARIDALGHVNRELRGVITESVTPHAHAETVLNDTGSQEIGRVTSFAAHPEGQLLALAYLKRGFQQPGTHVLLKGDAEPLQAHVFWPH